MEQIDASHFDIQMYRSMDVIDATVWDEISAGQPFQSHRWYSFGEKVMSDCPPTYLIVRHAGHPVARAALYRTGNEPLPIPPGAARKMASMALARWPMMISRSPMAYARGVILPQDPVLREPIAVALNQASLEISKQAGSSFLVFDFLEKTESINWGEHFRAVEISDPGTVMVNRWESLQDYLAKGNKKDRWNYKQTMRIVSDLGSVVTYTGSVPNISEALELIQAIEHKHGSIPVPWMQALLENMALVDGTWIESRIDGELVGCLLALEDNGAQLVTALGHREDIGHIYFQLLYAGLECAFEKKVKLLRWGSGAYFVKKRLGFELELNNNSAFSGTGALTNVIARLAG